MSIVETIKVKAPDLKTLGEFSLELEAALKQVAEVEAAQAHIDALLPVLTNTGRGSDIMIPMAIPAFGGMTLELITLFAVPVLYCGWQEARLRFRDRFSDASE